MKINQFPLIILIATFLISCKTSIKKESPIINLEENIENKTYSEKKEWK